jgi:hypothetical protein
MVHHSSSRFECSSEYMLHVLELYKPVSHLLLSYLEHIKLLTSTNHMPLIVCNPCSIRRLGPSRTITCKGERKYNCSEAYLNHVVRVSKDI